MSRSAPEWNEMTWNLVTGCTKVSPGCQNCYAEGWTRRLQNLGVERYQEGFTPRIHEGALMQPISWPTPRRVFISPNSDLFHPDVPPSFIQRTFDVIDACPQHQFELLTKRAERVAKLADELAWPTNLSVGVSVEDQQHAWRAEALGDVPASTRFVAVEPLLGPIDELPLDGIDLVMVSGEFGPRARVTRPEWIDSIVSQCLSRGVPFTVEQWGGLQKFRAARARRHRVPQPALD